MTSHEWLEHLSKKLSFRLLPYSAIDGMKMRRCVHPLNHPNRQARYCRRVYCGMCQRMSAELESKLLRDNLLSVRARIPRASFLHFCATAPDCNPSQIRETIQALKAGWQRLVRKAVFRKHCVGWFLTFDVIASEKKRALENAHIHAVVVMKPSYSGRHYLNMKRWERLWQSCVDPRFYRSIQVHKRQNVARLAAYVIKYSPNSFFASLNLGILDPERIIERQTQIQDLRRYTAGGLLREYTKMPKDSGTGFITIAYPTRNHWRRELRKNARLAGREPEPL